MSKIHSYSEDVDVSRFHTIDRHAQQVPMHNIYSEDGLIQYLEVPINKSDKHKNIYIARAVIAFLNEINISRRKSTFRASESLTAIIYGNSVDSFIKLCRMAGVEVTEITGKLKGLDYKPGADNEECLQSGKWCAFKSNDIWYLVHPQWAISSCIGVGYGGHTIEGSGRISIQPVAQSKGQTINVFNDFWFCTKPEIFIHHCYPDDPAWQLLTGESKSLEEFFSLPFFQQGYYEAGLELVSERSCSLNSTKGVCIITFSADKKSSKNMEFNYMLSIVDGDISAIKWDDLCQLVIFIPELDMYTFRISLPVEGTYLFEIMVLADDIVTNAACTDFKIACTEACKNCRRVPLNVGIEGFGYGHEAKKAGLKHPSEPSPVVVLRSPDEIVDSDYEEDEAVNFQIDSDRIDEVEFSSDIIDSNDGDAVRTHAYVDKEKGKLIVKASARKAGAYTLAIKSREKDETGSGFKTVANYIVTTDKEERQLHRNHETLVKQRKKEITKEQKVLNKTRRKNELLNEIKNIQSSMR